MTTWIAVVALFAVGVLVVQRGRVARSQPAPTDSSADRMREIARNLCGVRVYGDAVEPSEVASLLRRGATALDTLAGGTDGR